MKGTINHTNMKNWLTKKNVLILSLLGVTLFLSPVVFYKIFDCYNYNIFLCTAGYQQFASLFVLFVPNLVFSLITYKMHQSVFDYWMKFAVWAVPLLMVITFLIFWSPSNGLGVEGVISEAFNMVVAGILYFVFILISIWKIVSAHKKFGKQ